MFSFKRSVFGNIVISVLILAVCTLIGFAFFNSDLSNGNIIAVFIQGILIIAILTEGRVYSMTSSIISVLVVNFFFVLPYYSFEVSPDSVTTLIVLFLISVIISTLTSGFKKAKIDRMNAEERVRQEELKFNLLRSISHDLRTPLTSIRGMAHILRTDSNNLSEEKRQEMYTSIEDESEWLEGVIENLLVVTGVDNESVRLNITAEVVSDIVESAVEHVDTHISRSRVRVIEPSEILLANMDAKLITQVLINLINNAYHHAESDGEIELRYYAGDDNMVHFIVADHGIGISDEDKEKIFELFYTTGNKRSGDMHRGMGLGLYLCRSIVEACGGQIAVKDNHPTGTIFEFTLPRAIIRGGNNG